MTENEAGMLRAAAIHTLDKSAHGLREKLLGGVTHVREWEDTPHGKRTKVGRGWLYVIRPEAVMRPNQYPGVNYVSSMGRDSDDSYSGFLPGVTFDEAMLLVYGDFLTHTGR